MDYLFYFHFSGPGKETPRGQGKQTASSNILSPAVQHLTKLLADVTVKFISLNVTNALIFMLQKM